MLDFETVADGKHPKMANHCYANMFRGCTGLRETPELPAETLAYRCYNGMFYGCTGLTEMPNLPATTLADYCYQNMFYGCTGIKMSATRTPEYRIPWSIPTGAAEATGWNTDMFKNTGGTFTGNPEIGVTYYVAATEPITDYLTFSSDNEFTLATNNSTKNWDGALFYSTDLSEWKEWDGGEISSSDTGQLYMAGIGNSVITNVAYSSWVLTGEDISCDGNIETLLDFETVADGKHPKMASSCYANMFYGCTSLVKAPLLPAETLADNCYGNMFDGCTNLSEAPLLPAKTLAPYCYKGMFYDCTGLREAPLLPAETLANSCYAYMFSDCTNLIEAPSLPATTLVYNCYYNMFGGCTGLRETPELPAETLADNCYAYMFYYCTSLIEAPSLPATTLADNCYDNMFYGCTSLIEAPALPAKTLTLYCYYNMFYGCTGIKMSATRNPEYRIPWSIPTGAAEATGWNTDMFKNTGGTFTGNPEIGVTYYVAATEPIADYLTFSSDNEFTLATYNSTKNWDGELYYSTDLEVWRKWSGVSTLSSVSGKLYMAGMGNTKITSASSECSWVLTGEDISCDGNIETLLDFETVADGKHPKMASGCYANMFYECTSLVKAPLLPATTLADNCYGYMFDGCTGLREAPLLPAETLAPYCYNGMFYGCTGLREAPLLPAETLAYSCYSGMFIGCTNLIEAPSLPATTLAHNCYAYMFSGCTGLRETPELPAETLAYSCYAYMFSGCTGLRETPELPAETLANNCYDNMFYGCTSLIEAPLLPAKTLTLYCYYNMFYGCTGIKMSETQDAEYNIPWSIPAEAAEADYWSTNMFAGTGGTFTGSPEIGVTYYMAAPMKLGVTLAEGAQVRIGGGVNAEGKVNEGSGLRFIATVDRNDTLANEAEEIGVRITAEGSSSCIDIKAEKWQNGTETVFTAAVTNLNPANYNRRFTATPYVIVNGEYTFGDSVTRSVYQVASGLLTRADADNTEYDDTALASRVLYDVLNAYVNQTGIRLMVTDSDMAVYNVNGSVNTYSGDAFFTVSDVTVNNGIYTATLNVVGEKTVIKDYWKEFIRINNNNSAIQDYVTMEIAADGRSAVICFDCNGALGK